MSWFYWQTLNLPNNRQLCSWYLENNIFIKRYPISPFPHYFHFEGTRPSIWKNLKAVHPRMFCARFGWYWTSGSGEEYNEVSDNDRQRKQFHLSENPTSAFGSVGLKRFSRSICGIHLKNAKKEKFEFFEEWPFLLKLERNQIGGQISVKEK